MSAGRQDGGRSRTSEGFSDADRGIQKYAENETRRQGVPGPVQWMVEGEGPRWFLLAAVVDRRLTGYPIAQAEARLPRTGVMGQEAVVVAVVVVAVVDDVDDDADAARMQLGRWQRSTEGDTKDRGP